MEVNHEGKKVNFGNNLYDSNRGQCIMSLRHWAQRWNVSKDSARHFLNLLQKDEMIKIENLIKTTRITVCNYDYYNGETHAEQTQERRKKDARRTRAGTNKNDKNVKNGKNVENIIPPSLEMVSSYCKEQNNHIDPNKFINYYEAKGWKVGNARMINWKAAVRTWASKEPISSVCPGEDPVEKMLRETREARIRMEQTEKELKQLNN